jgi:TfoX N-terminal domain
LSPDHVSELFAQFRPVSVRRLFGGAGLYADGVMFAILSRDVIYLKADDETRAAFEQEGCMPSSYQAKGAAGHHVILAHAGAALRRSRGTCGLGGAGACGGAPRGRCTREREGSSRNGDRPQARRQGRRKAQRAA